MPNGTSRKAGGIKGMKLAGGEQDLDGAVPLH
jgi:hypothetical protein